jgi:hypothetical protein
VNVWARMRAVLTRRPRVVLWGARSGDIQFGSQHDRDRAGVLRLFALLRGPALGVFNRIEQLTVTVHCANAEARQAIARLAEGMRTAEGSNQLAQRLRAGQRRAER